MGQRWGKSEVGLDQARFPIPSSFYFELNWVLAALCGLFLVVVSGVYCCAWASHCGGFSYCKAQALGHTGFRGCGTWTLELGLSSCGVWA